MAYAIRKMFLILREYMHNREHFSVFKYSSLTFCGAAVFHLCKPGVCITAKMLMRIKLAPKPG